MKRIEVAVAVAVAVVEVVVMVVQRAVVFDPRLPGLWDRQIVNCLHDKYVIGEEDGGSWVGGDSDGDEDVVVVAVVMVVAFFLRACA